MKNVYVVGLEQVDTGIVWYAFEDFEKAEEFIKEQKSQLLEEYGESQEDIEENGFDLHKMYTENWSIYTLVAQA